MMLQKKQEQWKKMLPWRQKIQKASVSVQSWRCYWLEQETMTLVAVVDLTNHDLELVRGQESNKYALQKYIWPEHLFGVTKGGFLSKENSLWNYLQHFAGDRTQQILRLNDLVEVEEQLNSNPMSVSYEANFLRDYFSDEEE